MPKGRGPVDPDFEIFRVLLLLGPSETPAGCKHTRSIWSVEIWSASQSRSVGFTKRELISQVTTTLPYALHPYECILAVPFHGCRARASGSMLADAPFSVRMNISMACFQRLPLSPRNAQRPTAFNVVIIGLDAASRPLSTTAQTVKTRAVGMSREAVSCIVMSTSVKEATNANLASLPWLGLLHVSFLFFVIAFF